MRRVTGLGGVFFKARDKARLLEWYRDRLGIDVQSWGGTTFEWREKQDPERAGSRRKAWKSIRGLMNRNSGGLGG